MRKEIKTANKIVGQLEKAIGKEMKKIKKANQENNDMKTETEQTHNQILALKVKNEEEKKNFEDTIKKLQQQLAETDSNSKRRTTTEKPENPVAQAKPQENGEEFANPADLLK